MLLICIQQADSNTEQSHETPNFKVLRLSRLFILQLSHFLLKTKPSSNFSPKDNTVRILFLISLTLLIAIHVVAEVDVYTRWKSRG